jgi:hypothetical protein
MSPLISVVIPTCRRPQLLQRCLDALAQQTLDPAVWELIIVDDAHADATRLQTRKFAERMGSAPRVLYLRPNGAHGPAAARNSGWGAARGEVIAFTDDDAIADPDWLRQGLHAMAHGQAAVRGRVDVSPPEQGLEQAEFVTANCFVRRSALLDVGGFDERFQRASREDSDLHFKLLNHYGSVPLAAMAVVQHPVREVPWDVSLEQQTNAMFDALLFKKYPHLYRAKVGRVHAPPNHYAIVLGTLAGLLAWLAGEPGLAAVFAAIVIGFVADFTRRRLQGTSHDPGRVLKMALTSFAIPFLSLYWRLAGAWRFRVPFF